MRKLLEKKPVLHAVLWIVIYIVTVNIGGALSEQLNLPNLVTGVFLLALSGILTFYLFSNHKIEQFGFKRLTIRNMQQALFYSPLVLLAIIQFIPGIKPSLSTADILIFSLLMIGTGFVEELIFRGFLFRGIQSKSGTTRAILISGITFGLGHIVNLMNGYSFTEQFGQIIAAVIIGIILALLVAITGNLLPGIVFHIIFNISGIITDQDPGLQNNILIGILLLTIPYAFYLFKVVLTKQPLEEPSKASDVVLLKTHIN